MKDEKILAAVALFSELYDNKKDIYDVIAEFIKAASILSSIYSFNPKQATDLLSEVFDFDIPFAVVKISIKNRLLRNNEVEFKDGIYILKNEVVKEGRKIVSEFETRKHDQYQIFEKLLFYAQKRNNNILSSQQIDELNECFSSYLLGNKLSNKFLDEISGFIFENQNDYEFKNSLNLILEGIVIYSGIRYTADLNEIGTWNHNLVIYLDTEHLFNATSINGSIYEQIFDDFFNLVIEINSNEKNRKENKKIKLRYFPENEEEINRFFYVGEQIVNGDAILDPSKIAMKSIVEGCKSPSDVISKKANFLLNLSNRGILLEDIPNSYQNHDYNIEDKEVLNSLKGLAIKNQKYYNEEECSSALKKFTKINSLRKGVSNNGFERIGYILLSGKNNVNFLAQSNLVKINERDIPFSTDIEFVTDKFWFKLKKGFNNKEALPKSFDILTKARLVLSSQITLATKRKFLEFRNNNDLYSKEQGQYLYSELRERVLKPEEFTIENLDDSLKYLREEDLEKVLLEKSDLEAKNKKRDLDLEEHKNKLFISENENLEKDRKLYVENERIKILEKELSIKNKNEKEKIFIENKLFKNKKKLITRIQFRGILFASAIILVILCIFLSIIIFKLRNKEQDTTLGTIDFLILIFGNAGILGLVIKNYKTYILMVKGRLKKNYLKSIVNLH